MTTTNCMINKKIAIIISWVALCLGCEKEQPIIENKQTVINYSIKTTDVSDVGLFTAVFHGIIDMPIKDENEFTIGFQLSEDSLFSGELTHLCVVDSVASDSTFLFSIVRGVGDNLDMPTLYPGTQYYVRSFIVLGDIVYIGNVKSFNTNQVEITTGVIDTITNSINCKVNIFEDYIWIDGFLGVCYGKTPDPTIDDNTLSNDNKDIILNEDGTYSVIIDFPILGSIFYYRAYYCYRGKTYYGETRSTFMPYYYVDMGLSVNWATCNIGASTEYELGDYYAWGETESKSNYDSFNYKWYDVSYNTFTKYFDNSSFGYIGYTDTLQVLTPEDDVAHVKWGDGWRMPTKAEQDELLNNCTWTWTTLNGVNGYRVTSKKEGCTDRSIFLPAAGYRDGTRLYYNGSDGYYWSSSLYTSDSRYAYFLRSSSGLYHYDCGRSYGLSVRPVCSVNVESFDIDCSELLLILDNTHSLNTVINGVVRNIRDIKVIWSSDNESVATVNAEGQVTALSIGTAIITATIMDKTATCTIKVVDETEIEHEYVDLGLSVKWATFNVGATKPEEYGSYYNWGESELNNTSDYKWSTLDTILLEYRPNKYREMVVDGYSKYNNEDKLTALNPEDDVAHIKWGGSWRMPTMAEQDDLRTKCIWTWYDNGNTEFNGVAGYKVTSNIEGYTDRFIFLPAAGYRHGSSLSYVGKYGNYWSSSLNSDNWSNAYYLDFNFFEVDRKDYFREYGRSVRPVCP